MEKANLITIIKANILLFISCIAFGSSFIATKIALQYYDPMFVAAGRLFIGAFAFLLFIGELKKVKIQKGDLKYFILIGMFEPFLCFIFEGFALKYTSASQAGIVTAILPMMVVLAAWYFLSEKISTQKLTGFIIAVIGVIWLSLSAEATEASPNPILGNFLEILAMVCATISIINIKKLSDRYNWFFITAIQIIVSSILFIPIILANPQTYSVTFAMEPFIAIVYLGLLVNMMAYGFYNYGITKIPAGQASSYVNLIPVFAMLFGCLILKEQFTLINALASIVVFAGVLISQIEKMPRLSNFIKIKN